MSKSPPLPLSSISIMPTKGEAARYETIPDAVQPGDEAAMRRDGTLTKKKRNPYAALTIRPGLENRVRLEEISQATGHSMQDILLHCFNLIYPLKK